MQKQVLKDAMGVAVYNYGYQAIIFASSVITGRLLTPAEYGFVALITVFTGFIAFFNDSGLSYIVIRSDYRATFFRAMFMLSIVIGLILSGVVALLAYPIALFQGNTDLVIPTLVVAITIFIQTLSVVPSALLRKSLQFNKKAKIDFWTNSLSTIVTIVLAFAGASYWSLIISQLFVAVSQFIWYNKSYNYRPEIISLKLLKVAFKRTKTMLFSVSSSRIINYWSNNFGNLIIGKSYGDASLGIYNRTYSLFNILSNLIAGVFQTILLPNMKRMKDEGKKPDAEFYNFLDIVMLLTFPAAVVFIFFGKEVIGLIWGSNWLEVGELLPYFGVMALIYMPITVSYNMFILQEKESLLLKLNTISTFFVMGSFGLGFIGSWLGISDVVVLKELVYITTLIYCTLVLPLFFYPLFFKVMDINKKTASITWAIRLLVTGALCFCINNNLAIPKTILVVVLLIDLLWNQRNLLIKLIKAGNNFITKRNNQAISPS